MRRSHTLLTVAGVIAWLLVGALAVIAVEFWGGLWGALPVLAAIVIAWYIGERMTPAGGADSSTDPEVNG
jgi:hypothetical protein